MSDQDAAPWTVGRLLNWTADYFKTRGGDSPRLDAEVLLAHARGCKRIELYTAFDEQPKPEVRDAFKGLVKRRAAGEPVAYLVASKEFYSLDLEVTADVLIPRPETELLVIAALDRLKERGLKEARVADVGTGSGAVAVAIAKHSPGATLTAIDKSPAAIEVARRNAARHKVDGRVSLVESDLFSAVDPGQRFDVIASNPPYVTTGELMGLDPGVRDYEPKLALDGGPDGVTVIEPLLRQSAERLKPGGALFIEVGPAIAGLVERLVSETPGLRPLPTQKDLAGHERIVGAERA
ncbi:MAG: peptide chain release factor N(5)-glutamine methyltransferase [Lacipirellulaceae bacterium]